MFLFFSHEVCGISAPWPGLEPATPVLEGDILTTGSSGKSPFGSILSHFPFHLCSLAAPVSVPGRAVLQDHLSAMYKESDLWQLQEKSRSGLRTIMDLPATSAEVSSWRSLLGTQREQVSHYPNPAWGAKLAVPEAPLPSTFTSPYQTGLPASSSNETTCWMRSTLGCWSHSAPLKVSLPIASRSSSSPSEVMHLLWPSSRHTFSTTASLTTQAFTNLFSSA